MALDGIKSKWIVSNRALSREFLEREAFGIIDMEQGCIPIGAGLMVIPERGGGVLVADGVPVSRVSVPKMREIVGMADAVSGILRDGVELRYRLCSDRASGQARRIIAVKKDLGGGMRREVEFEASSAKWLAALRRREVEPIAKTRYSLPSGNLSRLDFEIDVYDSPALDFISIGHEFVSEKERNAFKLPSWLSSLYAEDVSGRKTFKNKNLMSNPKAANAEYRRLANHRLAYVSDHPGLSRHILSLYNDAMFVDRFEGEPRWNGQNLEPAEIYRENDAEQSSLLAAMVWFSAVVAGEDEIGHFRGESVANYSWRLAHMVSTFSKALDMPDGFDRLRAMKMALERDFAKWRLDGMFHGDGMAGKFIEGCRHNLEESTLRSLAARLPGEIGDEIMSIWREYDGCSTPTARFVRALDKIEATTRVLAAGIPYNPEDRGLHGNECYMMAPELWPVVGIMKARLKSDYAEKGYAWRPEFDEWRAASNLPVETAGILDLVQNSR